MDWKTAVSLYNTDYITTDRTHDASSLVPLKSYFDLLSVGLNLFRKG